MIITLNESIVKIITQDKYLIRKYPEYFYEEIKNYIDKEAINKFMPKEQILDKYDDYRKDGENETYICEIIRKDMIEEFTTYISKTNYPLDSKIEISIFETNYMFLKKEPTLIEYAAFYGSIQIFKYLYFNKAQIKPEIWLYLIHNENPSEMIDFLKENKIRPPNGSYDKVLGEAIKCHHNEIANFILKNYIDNEEEEKIDDFDSSINSYSFHYHNYAFFPSYMTSYSIIFYACQYNYLDIVLFFLQERKVDINHKIIIHLFFLNTIQITFILIIFITIIFFNDIFIFLHLIIFILDF